VKSLKTRGKKLGTMEGSVVFLVVVVMAVGVSGREQCTTDQHRQMQADFRECSVGFTSKNGLSACEIITKVVNVCGASWNRCHGPRVVREMKEEHIGRYDQHYGGDNGLKDCPITQDFRSSGRKTSGEVGPLCTDTKTTKVQKDFQQCSHEEATQLYRASMDMTSGNPTLEEMLCQALKTTLTTCIEPLSECFGPEDVEQMRASTETDQKKFLVRIMDGKVTEEAANRCTAVKGKESNPLPVAPIGPVSAQRMPILPVGQSEEKVPIPPIGEHPEQTPKVTTQKKLAALQSHLQGGSAVNSVQEEEEKKENSLQREPPIGDVMKENEPPIGDVGAQMGWESLDSKGLEEKKVAPEPVKEEAAQAKEEAAAQKQGGRVVQLVQPSFKSNSSSRNFLGVFWLLLSLLPLLLA